MTTEQKPLNSGFGPETTAKEVIAALDLTGKIAIVTGGYSGVGSGRIHTDLARYMSPEELAGAGGAFKTTEQGAATSIWCATTPQLDGKGGVYCMDVDIAGIVSDFDLQGLDQEPAGVLPWAIDPELADRLWTLSEQMTGVKFNDSR